MSLEPTVNVSTSSDALLYLLTWTGKDGTTRVVNNLEDVTSRGQVFQAYPFSLNLQVDDGEKVPEIQIVIDNVDERLTTGIRGFLEAPTVKIELISSAQPDVIEKTIDFLRMESVTYDAMSIQAKLVSHNMLAKKFPAEVYDGTSYPDLMFR